jgi:predicted ArsR family transcriptional regulator
MRYSARPDTVARTHRALAEVSRLRILELLRARPAGMDAAEAADEVGLHLATARTHLEILVEAGLVERHPEARTERGRPRVIYRAAEDDGETAGSGYRLLAEMLASLVESSVRDPAGRAETAGAAWGRALVERARPLTRLPRAEAMRRLQELLDELGFEPEVSAGGRRILLHRCPFRQVAGEHQSVVCSAHLGLIKGALGELGGDADAATIEPLVTPTLCVTHLPARRQ